MIARVAVALALALAAGDALARDLVRGQAVYVEHCAACHGARLEGQPDWQVRGPDGLLPAPPHDASGHTWHHGDDTLLRIVRDGMAALVPGYRTTMPAFAGVLSDAEIRDVLAWIRSTWPPRLQAIQAEITARERARR
ncbi:cytochrome c [Elioraea sp.]|uniref:c-type cytochrome n=1 Tax=Elioraea sp. TaxID=2185103 RepID=UPI0021DC1DED|nr:cytochrome c [Elioraea sp.]GIX09304.1 MAG: cytochrome [Elioraea sp.]